MHSVCLNLILSLCKELTSTREIEGFNLKLDRIQENFILSYDWMCILLWGGRSRETPDRLPLCSCSVSTCPILVRFPNCHGRSSSSSSGEWVGEPDKSDPIFTIVLLSCHRNTTHNKHFLPSVMYDLWKVCVLHHSGQDWFWSVESELVSTNLIFPLCISIYHRNTTHR